MGDVKELLILGSVLESSFLYWSFLAGSLIQWNEMILEAEVEICVGYLTTHVFNPVNLCSVPTSDLVNFESLYEYL